MKNRSFVIFSVQLVLMSIALLTLQAFHFAALNVERGESVNFFGAHVERIVWVDGLLAITIICFVTSIILMLYMFTRKDRSQLKRKVMKRK